LKTDDLNLARERLPLEMMKAKSPTVHPDRPLCLNELLDLFSQRLGTFAPQTLRNRKAMLKAFRVSWEHPLNARIETISKAMLEQWLASQKHRMKGTSLNDYLTKFLRPLFRLAVDLNAIADSPVDGIRKFRVEIPIRLTPAFETAMRIVQDVRAQVRNARAQQSADVLELMLKTGCGQGEVKTLRGEHIDLATGRIWFYRAKTSRAYSIPIYPWLKPLVEKFQAEGRLRLGRRVCGITNPRIALMHSCKRLGLPPYTPRAFRRSFVTECIQRSIDFKVIGSWVGHSPSTGGRLVAEVYGALTNQHSLAMAQRLK
jgi:integrase